MKRDAFVLPLLLVAALALVAPARAFADATVSISVFHSSLEPYGTWVTAAGYGVVWCPSGVSARWQPYLNGEWVYTEYGWTWVSYDPWGPDPWHYGTWVLTARYGWVWIPGTIWAPAWVTWCIRDGAIGWAPVPPSVTVTASGYLGRPVVAPASAYVFVPTREFAGTDVRRARIDRNRNAALVRSSRIVTEFSVARDVVRTGGPDPGRIRQATGRSVRKADVSLARTRPARLSFASRGDRGVAVISPARERASALRRSEPRRGQGRLESPRPARPGAARRRDGAVTRRAPEAPREVGPRERSRGRAPVRVESRPAAPSRRPGAALTRRESSRSATVRPAPPDRRGERSVPRGRQKGREK